MKSILAIPLALLIALGLACTEPSSSTETGFDCFPTCGEILCGNGLSAIYKVTLTVPQEGLPTATLEEHLAGPVVQVSEVGTIANAGAQTGDQGIVHLHVDGKTPPTTARWYFEIEGTGAEESILCDWTAESGGRVFTLDELSTLNESNQCFELTNDLAPPKPCPDDTPN